MPSIEQETWCQRWQAVLAHIQRIETETALDNELQILKKTAKPSILAFVNAHAMNSIAESGEFFDAIRSADVVFRDGSGMATLYKMLGQSPGLNLNGTDLIPRIIHLFNGSTIALLGTQEPYLGNAKARISREIAPASTLLTEHGFHQADAYVAFIKKHQPSLIVLGMGMPKQEQVAMQLKAAIEYPCLILCGGAIIDFLGGKITRAPALVRRIGMEWVYRLALEPLRLFQRYVIGNPLFLMRAITYDFRQIKKRAESNK